jgi:hypothetical protein
MLKITEDAAHGCLILEPAGPISRRDLDRLSEHFDAWVNARDTTPNLVIRAASFPTWTDLAALLRHLRFIRQHHRLVRKVAFVSDARALDVGPRIARHIVSAEIRHFPSGNLEAALGWVGEGEAEGSHVTVIDGLPDDVLGIAVHGVISARDYAETIVPLIEAKLKAPTPRSGSATSRRSVGWPSSPTSAGSVTPCEPSRR